MRCTVWYNEAINILSCQVVPSFIYLKLSDVERGVINEVQMKGTSASNTAQLAVIS